MEVSEIGKAESIAKYEHFLEETLQPRLQMVLEERDSLASKLKE